MIEIDSFQLEYIRQKHKLKLIILHGSQVDQQIHAQSDVDVAVLADSKYEYLELLADLANALQSDKIDLVDVSHADPLFLYNVINKSKLLAGDPSDYTNLQLKAFHRYQEYKPYLELEKEFVKQQLEQYVTT